MPVLPPPPPTKQQCAVSVYVRVRPSLGSSITPSALSIHSPTTLTVTPPTLIPSHLQSSTPTHQFTYDKIFPPTTPQPAIYDNLAPPLLGALLNGYNATVLAYGQTGSGKTYTMGSESGETDGGGVGEGLIPRFMEELFRTTTGQSQASTNPDTPTVPTSTVPGVTPPVAGVTPPVYHITASFLEVYGEDIHDLLAPPPPTSGTNTTSGDAASKSNNMTYPSLPLREDSSGVSVVGLSSVVVCSAKDALKVLRNGTRVRTTAATLMNKTSSRSHAVFTVAVEKREGGGKVRSKLTFVDLAGSERMKKTGAEGERMREGIQINVGLLALGNVINALAGSKGASTQHVPYRQSKLTRLLQDALGGNSRTAFLACVSPSDTNVSESLSTLKYANRAKEIVNGVVRGVDGGVEDLRRLGVVREALRWELGRVKFGSLTEECIKWLEGVEGEALKKSGGGSLTDIQGGYAQGYVAQGYSGGASATAGVHGAMGSSVGRDGIDLLDDDVLDGLRPDEDMAILDQLLDLQQGEAEFARGRAEGEEEIAKIDSELTVNNQLFDKLRGNLQVYHDMKGKYEQLVTEVNGLETEKLDLAEQLKKVEADPSRGCSQSIKRKMEAIETSLNKARVESRRQKELCKKAEGEASRARIMQKKVEELKKGKVALVKKQEDVIRKHREFTVKKTGEIEALKRRERKQGKNVTSLQSACHKHQRALDRRTSYCQKIAGKLKQTEAHLMRLLAMRKRELEKSSVGKTSRSSNVEQGERSKLSRGRNKNKTLSRMSFVQPPSWSKDDQAESTFAAKNQEIASVKFLIENYLGERLEVVETREKYESCVTEYSDVMRQMVEEVNKLSMVKEEGEEEAQIMNAERIIEDLELRLELTGTDMEELRGRLGDQLEEDKDTGYSVQDEGVLRMIGDLTAPVARTMMLELMETLTETEMQARGVEQEFRKKDANIEALEMENRDLRNKLANFAEIQTSFGEDPEAPMKMRKDLSDATRRISETKEQLTMAEAKFHSAGIELAECKEKLSVVDLSKEVKKEAASTLAQLQAYWRLLGVDLDVREKLRVELETCVEDKCSALLRDASRMEHETRQEIGKLTKANSQMERLMGVLGGGEGASESSPVPASSRLSLLEQKDAAKEKFEEMQPKFVAAQQRKKRIHADAKSLLSALEQSDSECSQKLRTFLNTDVDAEGVFEESLLKHCEGELRTMRVMKSELLVQSNVAYERANVLAKETHTSSEEIFELCKILIAKKKKGGSSGGSKKKGALDDFSWWTEAVCQQVCTFVSTPNMKVTTDSLYQNHLLVVAEAIEQISSARREFSTLLGGVLEEAHKQLMSVVEGEDDATEAYASFHEALFRLPRLSRDLIVACVDELKGLVPAADVMMQSETEALTVVWDALETKSEARGLFWGECDDSVKKHKKESSGVRGLFSAVDAVVKQSKGESEEWLLQCLAEAKVASESLTLKLFKLKHIHCEVEKKRMKQDIKSKIVRLDHEIRIIDAKLAQFEEKASNKQRLVSKKANSGVLLKEEKFRKHMQAKFISKLESLKETLKDWNDRERVLFDVRILSEEVQGLLSEGSDERTQFMHLRTVTSGTATRRKSMAGQGGAVGAQEEEKAAGRVETVEEGDEDAGSGNSSQSGVMGQRDREISKESVAAALAAAEAAAQAVAQPRKNRSRAASLAAYKINKKAEVVVKKEKGGRELRSKAGEVNRRNTIAVSTPAKSRRDGGGSKKATGISVFGNLLDTPTKENKGS